MDIKKLLPFLDDESLSMYLDAIKEGKVSSEDAIYALPFLNRSHIKEIYQLIQDKKIELKLEQLLPFMDDETIGEIYQKIMNKEITNIDEEAILPFLSTEKIRSLFKEYLNKL